MKVLRTIWSEFIGLFVDDWLFAALIVGWVILFKLLVPHPAPALFSLGFFAGLAAFTLLFAVRKARAK